MTRSCGVVAVLLAGMLLPGCGSDDPEVSRQPPGPPWQPGTVYRTEREPNARGLLDRRGLVHAHSVYSHDACDGEPRNPDGTVREDCLADFRRGVCQAGHDFVFLSDHTDSFAQTEFPDTLLHRPDQGDVLVTRDGQPVASWLACEGADPALILAGNEGALLPVGFERHVAATPAEREAILGSSSADSIAAMKAAGAVVIAQHTEDRTADELATADYDGFEMFNLHANALTGAGGAIELIGKLDTPEELPHPDLALLPILNEDPRYVETWGSTLARGVRRTTTIGTDCHENTFKQSLSDGERIDSYRRMMIWMSNHLLVTPAPDGSFGDVELKDALRRGRLYGVFEVMGYPVGFDFHASSAGASYEMGDQVALASGVELSVTMPEIQSLDPDVEPPLMKARLLRAREGGWDVVAESDADITHTATEPGAYRAEIRMQPRHLRALLSSFAELADEELVYIYSNAIYVE